MSKVYFIGLQRDIDYICGKNSIPSVKLCTGTVLPALYYRHLLKEDLKPTIPLDKNKNIYWIFCMCTEYFACVLNILHVYWIFICELNIFYVSLIFCMCTEYFLCVVNILYVYWIFCMCNECLVCVLNILYV